MKHVNIYTDGACRGNPGRGGFGVILEYKGKEKELSGGFALTTNNRMELLAAIEGLALLKEPCAVTLYSDSKYLVDAIEKGWAARWRKNGWMRTKSDKALNPDLWERLLALLETHKTEMVWVKGHSGNKYNERCDVLATTAADGEGLARDDGYEGEEKEES